MAQKDRLVYTTADPARVRGASMETKEHRGGLTPRWNAYVLNLADRVAQREEEMFDNPGAAEAKRFGFISEAYVGSLPIDQWPDTPHSYPDKALISYPVSPAEPIRPQLGYELAYDHGEVTRDEWYSQAVTLALGGDWYPLTMYFDKFILPGIQSYIHNTFSLPYGDSHAWRSTTCEDIVQVVRMKTVEFLPQLTVPHKEDYTAWCFRVAKHTAIDVIRKRPVPELRLVETIARENDRVIVNLDERAMLNDVRRALLALDSYLQRDALMLASFGDYTNAEIAVIQGSNEGAVKSVKHRGRDTLARYLKIKE